jgi:hypothetical protein
MLAELPLRICPYRGELVEVDSVGPDDVLMFQCLVDALKPFLKSIT